MRQETRLGFLSSGVRSPMGMVDPVISLPAKHISIVEGVADVRVVTNQSLESPNPRSGSPKGESEINKGVLWSEVVSKVDRNEKGDATSEGEGSLKGDPKSNVSSWSSVVKNETLVKYEYETEEVDGCKVISVPDEMIEEAPLWEDILVGKFLSKIPPVGRIYSLVNRIWTLDDKSEKIEVIFVDD